MNAADEDRDMQNFFTARDASAPEPSPALFATTMGRIDTLSRKPKRRWAVAAGWWTALALPAQIALAASLVVIAGSVGVGTLGHHGVAVTAPDADRIEPMTLESNRALATRAIVNVPAPPPPAAAEAPELQKSAGSNAALPPQIARTGTESVLVRDVPASLRDVNAIVAREGGAIGKLADTTPDAGEPHVATVSLTVPAARYDATVAAIAATGKLTARSIDAEAIGDAIVDSTARLRNLRREESDLLRIMDRSGKVSDVLDVESKLSDVRGQIESLDAQLAQMHHRVATSALDVTLTEERTSNGTAAPSTGARLDTIWHAALRAAGDALLALVGASLWLVAFAPFWIAAALIAGIAVMRLRPRF